LIARLDEVAEMVEDCALQQLDALWEIVDSAFDMDTIVLLIQAAGARMYSVEWWDCNGSILSYLGC
jgi:hypothetical protein